MQDYNAIGDRCNCGRTVVEPAIHPPCSCQVGQDDSSNSNVVPPRRQGRGRRGMLGWWGLRGTLAQFGGIAEAPGSGGLVFNRRLLPRPRNNPNSIIQQSVDEIDENSIVT